MKKICALMMVLSVCSMMFAQTALDAKESDPTTMGWMQGFPPAEDKILSPVDGSFFTFPGLRYSVNHMREFSPTRVVPAAKDRHYGVKTEIDSNIDKVTFTPWGSDTTMTWAESLEANYTDGIIVMHKGKIVYEKYLGGLDAEGIHAAMSVSKSFAGTIASILIAEGVLDPTKLVIDYIPELKDSAFADATVEEVLDMTTAIQFSEDYSDPNAEVWEYGLAGNVFRPADYTGPKNYYEYLATVKKLPGQEHGEVFGYKTANAELVGWIISRASGKDLADLISEKIWKPMGAFYDGYYIIDPAGKTSSGGGFSLNLRDMAVFGELMRRNGNFWGTQIIPQEAIAMIREGGSQEVFEKSGDYPTLKGWSYKNMWWITHNEHGAYMARGVHGQAIYIDPTAEMVIARFSSAPNASNKYLDPTSLPAYEAVAEYLMNK